MAVTKQQKSDILAGLVEQFKAAKSIGFATTTTLTVAEFAEMRTDLREVDATYTVAKKTLMKLAIKQALDIDLNLADMPGQVGAVCSNDDAVAGLGAVNKAVKASKGEKVEWTVCIFEGELKSVEETKVIASMPSRDTLLGRLVGSMQSPLSAMARFMDAAAKDLEAKGVTTVGELKGASEAPAVAEVKEEAPKVEEKKEEVAVEAAPATEQKAPEAPTEEVKTEETPSTEEKKD